jgi:hypothetical protein
MTFSEFISIYAWKQYLEYCSKKGTPPILDTEIKTKKICALCLPKNKQQ